jgi:ribonucleoside-diphosphate reductase subunit M2
LIDDRKRSVSPDSPNAEDELEELRKKFVGEIDLPESQWLHNIYELIFN